MGAGLMLFGSGLAIATGGAGGGGGAPEWLPEIAGTIVYSDFVNGNYWDGAVESNAAGIWTSWPENGYVFDTGLIDGTGIGSNGVDYFGMVLKPAPFALLDPNDVALIVEVEVMDPTDNVVSLEIADSADYNSYDTAGFSGEIGDGPLYRTVHTFASEEVSGDAEVGPHKGAWRNAATGYVLMDGNTSAGFVAGAVVDAAYLAIHTGIENVNVRIKKAYFVSPAPSQAELQTLTA